MKLNQILQFLVPKEKAFFPLFEASAKCGADAARKLVELVNEPDMSKKIQLVQQIRDIEHKADEITHQLLSQLSTSFITPFDREDIQYLATTLDDVCDYINAAAKRIELYKIQGPNPAMEKMADVIVRGAEAIAILMPYLRNMDNRPKIQETLVLLNNLENHADDIFDMALAQLFEDDVEVKTLIKQKEVLSVMEETTDRFEDIGNAVETILIKTA